MTKQLNNTFGFPGDYNLHSIKLRSFRHADFLDITPLFASIEVFENLYEPFMSINLDIVDSTGLMDKTRIVGEEFIDLDVREVDDVTGIIQTFYIYKITDGVKTSDRGITYTLHGVSLSALADMNMLISKSFSGQPSDIVTAIYKQFLSSEKTLTVEPTKNVVQYISNYWSPIKNIKFLTERAVSRDNKAPAYFFFENKAQFLFVSLNTLVQQEAASDYFYTVNRKILGDDENKMKIIEKIYIDESFDYIKRAKTGAYGNRTLIVNPMNKTYNYNYYDFIQSFYENARLNTEPFSSIDSPRQLNSYFTSRVAPDSSFGKMTTESNEEWFIKNPTEYASIDAQKICIDVPGRFNIYAGSVLNIFMFTDVINSGDTMETLTDSVLSGRYLVTGLKHLFTRQRHTLHIEISKDSLITVGGKK